VRLPRLVSFADMLVRLGQYGYDSPLTPGFFYPLEPDDPLVYEPQEGRGRGEWSTVGSPRGDEGWRRLPR
jgi:hypothetical protein